ncbi:AAA family ATPase [Vibrio sp.]|uniref:AAA family ATPase n=1 Tax=Vibrio sp. TaxID=678 RepID=UPI003D0C3C72
MKQETWRTVTPQYDNLNSTIETLAEIEPVTYCQTQPRFLDAVNQFVRMQRIARILLVNSPDNSLYRKMIATQLASIVSDAPVVATESFDMKDILGSEEVDQGKVIQHSPGLLEKANGGYLIVSANLLLANPHVWPVLKAAMLGEPVAAVKLSKQKALSQTSEQRFDIKLIIMGDRNQLADVDYLDDDIYGGLSLYSELETEISINPDSIVTLLGFLNWICQQYQFPSLTADAVKRILVAGARFTEDQRYQPLDIMWYLTLFEEASLDCNGQQLDVADIERAIEHKYTRESYLPERVASDILDGHVIIETSGERVGQVNGLTVIDVPGHPVSYGEPARISCVIHFGDGDISDVERKAELGGNLHAKGMMIMQAFVSSALKLEEPLPYSASVVFEQSYCEVDGDSASLAELCSFVSALSEYPINQQIAVTGAVDQFGRVQAVGGLNEKIEGFYHVCKHQGLTGNQGVILPESNLRNLALHQDVLDSIAREEFHIWSVSHVDEAIPLIMGKPFRGDDESSVVSMIAQRIENYERQDHSQGIVQRIKNWFLSH